MTDHSSLLKEKNNPDIVERLSDRELQSLVNSGPEGEKAAAEITRLREDNKKLSDKAEALRKALVLVMDYPDVRKYLGSQVANVADAAIAATKEQQA